MRHKLVAKETISERIGDRLLKAEKGETVEFSARGAEVAMSTGRFGYAEGVPETEAEKARAKEARRVQKLASKPKDALVKKASRLNIPNAAKIKKPELAQKIVEAGEVKPAAPTPASAGGTLTPGEGKGE